MTMINLDDLTSQIHKVFIVAPKVVYMWVVMYNAFT